MDKVKGKNRSAAAELRRKAEKKLMGTAAAQAALPEIDGQRLIHELQVHQLELEMQNDELQRTKGELEASLGNYFDFYELSPIGYFTLDRNGDISAVNFRGTELLGIERSKLVGRRFGLLVKEEYRSCFVDFIENVFTSPGQQQCEVVLLKEEHATLFVQIKAVAAASGQECRCAVIDNAARKQAEDDVRANEVRLQLALEAAHLATWDWHIPSGTVVWNNEHYRMLGYEPDSFSPTYRHWADRVHPDDLPATEAIIQQTIKNGGDYRAEFRVVMPDGTVRNLEALGRIARDQTGATVSLYGAMIDITERKEALADLQRGKEYLEQRVAERTMELRLQRQRLADIIYGTNLGTWEWNVQTGETIINERWAGIIGYTLAELEPVSIRTWQDHTHPEDLKISRALLQRHFNGELDSYVCESRMRHKDGHWVWVLGNGKLLSRDADGKPLLIVGTNLEITDRKRAEIEREQYYKFFRTSTDIMVVADPNGAFIKINPASTQILGYSEAELVAKPFIDFVHADDRQATLDEMARQQLTGSSYSFVNRYVCRDGSIRWLSWRAVYNKDENCTYATGRDITESKRKEEALRKSEYEFRMLAEAMPQIVWITRPDGWNIYINQQWVDYTGLTHEESLGHGWSIPFHPDDRQTALDAWQNAVTNGATYSLESRLRRKDGVYKWWLIRGVPVPDDHGDVFKWFGTCTDIDEIKKAENERLVLEQQLFHAQKMESLGVLAGGIAHDFNNILMAIIGNAEMARKSLTPGTPGGENLQQIEQAAFRAADLARQMLAFSGKGKFFIERLDLSRLVEELLPILEVSISKKAVLRLNLSRHLPAVEADSSQLRQIVVNLVINASEAIGDAGGVITVTTGCRECDANYLKEIRLNENFCVGQYVYLEIADTGCGMDTETLGKLFDPFFSTKFTGRGLGMSAVQGIVRGHKGAIKVYSKPGKGTTIKVLLPAAGSPSEIVDTPSSPDDFPGSGTVLLVDDDKAVREVGAEMLRMLGFTVITANDGVAAVEAFKSANDIKLVILDLTMPQMDGEQCFRELRQIDPGVKVILSSGYSVHEVERKFAGKGVAGFIQKPYDFSTLKEALRVAV